MAPHDVASVSSECWPTVRASMTKCVKVLRAKAKAKSMDQSQADILLLLVGPDTAVPDIDPPDDALPDIDPPR